MYTSLLLTALAAMLPIGQEMYQPAAGHGAQLYWSVSGMVAGGALLPLPAPAASAQAGGAMLLAGRRQVRWWVAGADSARFAAWLYYSPDGGAHWRLLGEPERFGALSALTVDFGALPGSAADNARLRLVVADGVNACSAVSPPFRVEKKMPQDLLIVSPEPGSVVARRTQVRFEGSAFDADDGVLSGAALTWRSDRDGLLGKGVMLRTSALSAGLHHVTLTATDSDGNAASATVTLRVED